jgi:hypothetical protein
MRLLFILALVAIALLSSCGSSHDCIDEECFKESLLSCSKATYSAPLNTIKTDMEQQKIVGWEDDKCKVKAIFYEDVVVGGEDKLVACEYYLFCCSIT